MAFLPSIAHAMMLLPLVVLCASSHMTSQRHGDENIGTDAEDRHAQVKVDRTILVALRDIPDMKAYRCFHYDSVELQSLTANYREKLETEDLRFIFSTKIQIQAESDKVSQAISEMVGFWYHSKPAVVEIVLCQKKAAGESLDIWMSKKKASSLELPSCVGRPVGVVMAKSDTLHDYWHGLEECDSRVQIALPYEDTSLPHAIGYCTVLDLQKSKLDDQGKAFMYWAMKYDHSHDVHAWFRSSTEMVQAAFQSLEVATGAQKCTAEGNTSEPKEDCTVADLGGEIGNIIEAGRTVCEVMKKVSPVWYEMLADTYQDYISESWP